MVINVYMFLLYVVKVGGLCSWLLISIENMGQKNVLQQPFQPRLPRMSAPNWTAAHALLCTAKADNAKPLQTDNTPGVHKAWYSQTELPMMMTAITW